MTRTTVRNAAYYIATRQAFDAGNLTGESIQPGYYYSTGRLPEDEHTLLRHAFATAAQWQTTLYVVYSYRTPIAWALPDTPRLYVPGARYSHTTSRHQGICRAWGDRPGSYTSQTLQWLRTHR